MGSHCCLGWRASRECLGQSFLCKVLGYSWVDAVVFESLLELINAIIDFSSSILNLLNGHFIELLGLFILKFQLALLSFLLVSHILLPVLHTFLEPFFQESSVSLELVDLSSSDLLLGSFFLLSFSSSVPFCFLCLPHSLVLKLLKMTFHIHGLLRLVEGLESSLKE